MNNRLNYRGLAAGLVVLTATAMLSIPARALTLEEGLSLVAGDGWDTAIARSRQLAAREGAAGASARLRPQVRAYAGHTWMANRPEAIFGTSTAPLSEDHILRYGVEGRWLLTDFGSASSTVEAAEASAAAQELNTDLTRRRASLEFVRSYVDMLQVGEAVRVAADEETQFTAHLSDARALYEQGQVTRHDILTVEVALADARQRAISARDARQLAAARLNFLMARDTAEVVEPVDYDPVLSEVPGLAGLLERAAGERVELAVLDRQIQSRRAQLASVTRQSYPALTFSGGYGFEENPYRVHEDNVTAALAVTWDLYTGGGRQAETGRLRQEVAGLQLQRSRLYQQIGLEVLSDRQLLSGAMLREEVAVRAVERAQENLRLQKVRYEEGEASATDVTDAVTALSGARLNQAGARYDRQRAEAALLDAVGADLTTAYARGSGGEALPDSQTGEQP